MQCSQQTLRGLLLSATVSSSSGNELVNGGAPTTSFEKQVRCIGRSPMERTCERLLKIFFNP
jgi:hypothetical protein